MVRKTVRFTSADLTRALKAVKTAGLNITRIEIESDGKIVIITGAGEVSDGARAIEEWRAKRRAREATGRYPRWK